MLAHPVRVATTPARRSQQQTVLPGEPRRPDTVAMRTAWMSTLGVIAACGGSGETCDPDVPGTICTIAGSGLGGYGGDDGPAVDARLFIPIDVAVAPDGELWVLDFNNFMIRAVDQAGTIRRIVGTGEIGQPDDGSPALEAPLNHLANLVFHDGFVYIAGWHNSQVFRVRLDDKTLEHFAGRGVRTFYDGDGGPALEAALDMPAALAIDPAGNLVVVDQGNQVIRRIDRDGTIETIAGQCLAAEYDPCDGPLVPCPGSQKFACDLDACGHGCGGGFAGDGGPALAARFAQPWGATAFPGGRIVYDRAGNLILADPENHRIRRIDPTGTITTIAGTGERGYAGDGGPALAAALDTPVDVAVADDGTIYVSDVYNSCIRKIDPAGQIDRVVGRCTERGFAGDGASSLDALLDRPFGIELAGNRLYVADSFNHRVRVVRLAD
jgi:DNA-binding beta-propeller fold protein YncE